MKPYSKKAISYQNLFFFSGKFPYIGVPQTINGQVPMGTKFCFFGVIWGGWVVSDKIAKFRFN